MKFLSIYHQLRKWLHSIIITLIPSLPPCADRQVVHPPRGSAERRQWAAHRCSETCYRARRCRRPRWPRSLRRICRRPLRTRFQIIWRESFQSFSKTTMASNCQHWKGLLLIKMASILYVNSSLIRKAGLCLSPDIWWLLKTMMPRLRNRPWPTSFSTFRLMFITQGETW